MNKEKRKYNFFNIVVDKELLMEIRELRKAGVNWQTLTRNFLQVKTKELRDNKSFTAR